HRLGMRGIKEELEDLSFHYLDPFAYSEIEHILEIKKSEREAFITRIKETISERFKDQDFTAPPQIEGRVKSIYSIYKKMFVHHKSIEEIYDKYAVRIIVSTVGECYNVLGLVHDMFRPIPNRFKDYISTPKANMYQSLHTTVLGKEGIPFEIQIRTWEMHATAEYGIAAHWKYKQGISRNDSKMEQRLAWIRQVIEAQQTSDDVEEIVRIIKTDLAPEDIVVMTPKGDSVSLPIDSTVIDYAYKIHTQIGHKTVAAKVDGKMVPLDYKLQTGQICEIITSSEPDKGPNRAWLSIAKTNEAKSKIRSWFKKECRDENIQTGKAELEREFKHFRIRVPEEELEEFLADDLKRHNCNTLDDFYASIGYGGTMLSKILPRLKDKYVKLYQKEEEPENNAVIKPVRKQSSIILDKIDDCTVKFAQCCNPLPGDEIVGFITRGHGISVHTTGCTNYLAALRRNNEEELARWMDVQWTDKEQTSMQTSIEVIALDRVGLVYDITAILTEARIPILHSSSRNLKNGNALFEATITIAGTEQLKNLFDKLRRVKDVVSVERAKV
ncbi:MAG: RelA/SpoT family protein, partial [Porcipelethomonas sp.]